MIVGDDVNEMDASGEEVIHHVIPCLRDNGVYMLFSGLKQMVIDVMRATGLLAYLGEENRHADDHLALAAIYKKVGAGGTADAVIECPLMPLRWGGDQGR